MVNIDVEEYDEDNLFDEDTVESSSQSDSFDEEEDIPHGEVDFLHDVPIAMTAQVGSVQKTMRELLALTTGTIVEFNKVVGEPMDVLIGGRLMCRGEIVVVNERYGIRISEVIRAEDSAQSLPK